MSDKYLSLKVSIVQTCILYRCIIYIQQSNIEYCTLYDQMMSINSNKQLTVSVNLSEKKILKLILPLQPKTKTDEFLNTFCRQLPVQCTCIYLN